MLLQSELKYSDELTTLWHTVFGDETEYIKLFFSSVYQKSKTFASFDGEKIVSVFYLLDCKLKFNKKKYNGYYLYAAATDPNYRNKGLMSALINEGKDYCRKNSIDFISLVPGESWLYSYYNRFGFKTAMYKYICKSDKTRFNQIDAAVIDAAQYTKLRNECLENAFIWQNDEMNYVLKCFDFYGIKPYRTADCCFLAGEKDYNVKELICQRDKLSSALSQVSAFFGGEAFEYQTVFPQGEKFPFGMICPINSELDRNWSVDDIYMNLALD